MEPKWTWKMSTSLMRANAGQIWPLVKDFFNIHKWFPGVPTGYGVHGTNGEVGCVRFNAGFQIPAFDGGDVSWSKERLTVVDPIQRLISYEILDGNIGFKSYVSTIKVLPLPGAGEGEGCVIEWSVAVDPVPGWKMADLVKKYESGFQVMAKKMEDDALAAGTSEQAPAP
ncbi:lachrymatory-factor synthase-like [Diospyros lotus]|uniref:lachrymatory-factor synthase-like n=1 Tax=Diospyros lotus TaxID=55363 RepID=UPI0022533C30|nr:lachrymatory-factor synthase-like [Diospyros lotus]